MFADIATGHHAVNDVLLLVAVFLFVLCALLDLEARNLRSFVKSLGLAAVTLAFLVL